MGETRYAQGGIAISYSPPASASPEAKRRGHPRWQDEDIRGANTLPLQQKKQKKTKKYKAHTVYHHRPSYQIDPAKKNEKRFAYDHGQGDLPPRKTPKNL